MCENFEFTVPSIKTSIDYDGKINAGGKGIYNDEIAQMLRDGTIRDIYGNKVFGDNPSLAKCKATADFDSDGLKNYEEIGGIIQVDHVFTVWYTSDPTKRDTDGDGVDDGIDAQPLKKWMIGFYW